MSKITFSNLVRVGTYRAGRLFGNTDYTPFIILAPVIWLDQEICANGTCRASDDNVFLYRDRGHLSNAGSVWLGAQSGSRGAIEDSIRN